MPHNHNSESKIKRKALFWTFIVHLFLVAAFVMDNPAKIKDFVEDKIFQHNNVEEVDSPEDPDVEDTDRV